MDKPACPQRAPYEMQVEEGRTYVWRSCGLNASVLGLIQQRGRMRGLYPTFAGGDLSSDAGAQEAALKLVD